MELRWHRFRNEVTAADVSAAIKRGALLPIKKIAECLREETPWKLQFRFSPYDPWQEVPFAIEPHPPKNI